MRRQISSRYVIVTFFFITSVQSMSQGPFQASARATIYSDLENVNLNYNLQTLKQDSVNAKDRSYREGYGRLFILTRFILKKFWQN